MAVNPTDSLNAFNCSIIRIFHANGGVVGAGFLVSPQYVLTCAHVVATALNIRNNTTEAPTGSIDLDFPLVARGQKIKAQVVFWQPMNPSAVGEYGEDIAGLKLEGEPPKGTQSVRLVTADDLWEHPIRIFGFPDGHPNGAWASGVLRSEIGNRWVQIEDHKVTGLRVEHGFSGAPVWDERLEGIAGIAVAADTQRREGKVAFIIPTKVLSQVWSVVGQLVELVGEPPSSQQEQDPQIDTNVLQIAEKARLLQISPNRIILAKNKLEKHLSVIQEFNRKAIENYCKTLKVKLQKEIQKRQENEENESKKRDKKKSKNTSDNSDCDEKLKALYDKINFFLDELDLKSLNNIKSISNSLSECFEPAINKSLFEYFQLDGENICSALEREKKDLIRKIEDMSNYLARYMNLHENVVQSFFAGEPIEKDVFNKICSELDLEWCKILDGDFLKVLVKVVPEVRELRLKKIQEQCGNLETLNFSGSIKLNHLYVDVKILNKLAEDVQIEPSDPQQVRHSNIDESKYGSLDLVSQERKTGFDVIKSYSKVMILGKPGVGKSTFLQYVAIQCNEEQFQPDRVPFFIRLKTFNKKFKSGEDLNLFDYISKEFDRSGISNKQVLEDLLKHGRLLILLDGLDEVPEAYNKQVCDQISIFSEDYGKNQFIITCRIAVHKTFHNFTNVEIADFDAEQREDFVQKWFLAVEASRENGEKMAFQFIQELNRQENEQIRELARTPLLLNLTCLVFQGTSKFPSKRTELYKDGLEILLKEWDERRNVERTQGYRGLTVEHKKQFLMQLASEASVKDDKFFSKDKISNLIYKYFPKILTPISESPQLELDSNKIIETIEIRGLLVKRARRIYSFSHLTFQEYLTANLIVKNYKENFQYFKIMLNHITKKNWHEIFILAAEILEIEIDEIDKGVDKLLQLRKQQIDEPIYSDKKLISFLEWIDKKSLTVSNNVPYKITAIRAFYFICIVEGKSFDTVRKIDRTFDERLSTFERDRQAIALCSALEIISTIDESGSASTLYFTLWFSLRQLVYLTNGRLKNSLRWLQILLPKLEEFKDWWKKVDSPTEGINSQTWEQLQIEGINSQTWRQLLRLKMDRHLKISHSWKFNEQQRQLLQRYYEDNELLVDCLNRFSQVTPEVRQNIEDHLFLVNKVISCPILG